MDPTSGNNSAALTQLAQADVTFDDETVDGFATRGIMCPETFSVCVSLPFTFNDYLATTRVQTVKGRIFRLSIGVIHDHLQRSICLPPFYQEVRSF